MFLSLKCFGMSLYEKICDWHIGAQEMCSAELKAKEEALYQRLDSSWSSKWWKLQGREIHSSKCLGESLNLFSRWVPPREQREVTQSCPTPCYPVDCSSPVSSVHGIFQARILELVAISFSRGSSQPRDRTQVSHIADRCFNLCTARGQAGCYSLWGIMTS